MGLYCHVGMWWILWKCEICDTVKWNALEISPFEDLDDVGSENVDDSNDGALNFEDLDILT